MDKDTLVVEFAGEAIEIRTDFGLWEDVAHLLGQDPLMLIRTIATDTSESKITPLIKAVLAVSSNRTMEQVDELFKKQHAGNLFVMSTMLWGAIAKSLTPDVGGEADGNTQPDQAP